MVQNSDYTKISPYMAPRGSDDRPGWVHGLRQLYRNVVEEPMPGSFEDLLARIDRLSDRAPGVGRNR